MGGYLALSAFVLTFNCIYRVSFTALLSCEALQANFQEDEKEKNENKIVKAEAVSAIVKIANGIMPPCRHWHFEASLNDVKSINRNIGSRTAQLGPFEEERIFRKEENKD